MQTFRFGVGVWVGLQVLWAVAAAVSLDGTSAIVYQVAPYTFANGDFAQGFVRFNNGFNIPAAATVYMDTVVSSSGAINLNDSGVMVMRGNLAIDSNLNLPSGGYIRGKTGRDGEGRTIFLGGNLTLNSGTYINSLHITGDSVNNLRTGDLVIDGRGNTLTVADKAQIFVDLNVTLTLRNMTIRSVPKSMQTPWIQLAGPGSKLALDNVMFELGADFHFLQGQLFIHNDVVMTGSSVFVYQSPLPSFIASGATWSFEQGTTFSVAPSTYTDIPYTAGYATSNNFLLFADQSSTLNLSGCSFKTTNTGLRLTKGLVQFDNQVSVETQAGVDVYNTTPLTAFTPDAGGTTAAPAWSPDGRFFASGGGGSVYMYGFNGSSGPTGPTSVAASGSGVAGVAWSPDGRFIAAAVSNAGINSYVDVFKFNGSGASKVASIGLGNNAGPETVAWSPDGKFIVFGDTYNTNCQIYRFDGNTGLSFVNSVGTISHPKSVAWSPDGKFFAVADNGNSTSNYVQIFSFNGSSIGGVANLILNDGTYRGLGVAWSPDGRFLAAVTAFNYYLYVWRFNGTSTVPLLVSLQIGAELRCVDWSPDGRFLMVTNYGGSSLSFYRFNGTGVSGINTVATVASPTGARWSPDGNSVAVEGGAARVYRVNYLYSTQSPQGFSNGLLFGNSALGSAYNVNVQVNGGARVELKGKIKDDSA